MRPLALLVILSVCGNQHLYGEEAAAQGPGGRVLTSSSSSLTFAGSQLPEISLPEYKRLRTEALGRARVTSGPIIMNPQAQNRGIDPAALAALQMQRSYLENRKREQQAQGSSRGVTRSLSRAGTDPAYAVQPDAKAKIVAVNGRRAAPAFTPQPPDNHYKIQGCCFGKRPGKVQLKLGSGSGDGSRVLVLQFESPASWTNEEIGVQIDPGVSRLPDYTGQATLQVITAGNELFELPGCSFVAARTEGRLLTLIPSSWAKFNTRRQPQSPEELEYLSPPGRMKAGVSPTSSAFVFHSDVGRLPPGEDFFDFSQLQNGWIVESAQLESYSLPCPGAIIASNLGAIPDLRWSSRGLRVQYESAACVSRVASGYRFSMSAAAYALKVWIVGPAQTEFMQARLP